MKLTIVRHAQTNFNEKKLLNAKIDSKLTKKGEEEAIITGKYLNKKFHKIFSSPKIRTKKTTELIINQNRKSDDNKDNKTIILDERLIERDYGIFEGKPYQEVKKELNKFEIINYKNYNMEDFKNFQKRIEKFIKSEILKEENIGKEILIVSHSGTIKMLIYKLIKSNENYKKFKNKLNITNTSISTIEFEKLNKIKNKDIGFDKHLIKKTKN